MFSLKMATDNEAFNSPTEGESYEVASILRTIANQLESGKRSGVCMDANGNKVGTFKLTREGN